MESPLNDIRYITLPESFARSIGDFTLDPARRLPVQLPEGVDDLTQTEITLAMIVSGMLKIIYHDPKNPNSTYYKAFVLAAEPDIVNQLNLAAIAQEKKQPEFAEELFVTVNCLLPESATFINLATFYSTRAAKDKEKGTTYDLYSQKALNTLLAGLEKEKDDPDLLRETGMFHLYQGNSETAREFLERYLKVAKPDDKKKREVEKITASLNKVIQGETALLSVYDKIQMNENAQAIEEVNLYLEDHPKVWNAHFLKGWALRKSNRFDEARESLLNCLKLGERGAELFNELSLCELALDNRELAITYLDTAVDLDDSNITYLSNLAYLYLEDKQYAKARKLLELARNLDAEDPIIIHLAQEYEKETGDKLAEPVSESAVDQDVLDKAIKQQESHRFSAHHHHEEK